MTPRNQIEALDLNARPALLSEQLATTYHTRLPVYEDELDNVVGILHLKQILPLLRSGELDAEHLRAVIRPPYFVPVGTPLLVQLQQFQVDRQQIGLVVDEYGELLGLVTLEDILEEIVGDFSPGAPGGRELFQREPDGSVIVDGMAPLRMLNRKLGTEFPAGWAENAEWADRRTSGRYSGGGPRLPHRRAGARNPPGPGPRGQSGQIGRPRRPAVRAAFTNHGRAGIIDKLTFMRLE